MFVKLERELTKDDVGKKVKLRNGDIDTISKINSGDEYPLLTEEASYDMFGRFFTGASDNVYDIVEIEHVDEYINVADIPKVPSYKTSPTIQINIQDGMTVIKGKFLDSSGEEWYVTLDKVD